ncbi:MAG: class A beta-lactamase-related serine hydrolase [Oscillospiraceae bacterium]|jgi:beta-lactamase class A|nr:class A beta-lactamase-related serine hydrolase [Oscillospiraceae bacterium]
MLARIREVAGDVGFYYKNLVTGESCAFQADQPLVAASVIKLPIMMEAFRRFDAGLLDPDALIAVRDADRVPSCGVLTYLHDGVEVSVRDLVTLMIIVSDNTATNVLIDLLGIEPVNALLDQLGAGKTRLRRKMFDAESSARGIQNTITAGEMGMLLEKLYWGDVISPAASKAMLSILKNQRLNGKMPFLFQEKMDMAHKTGEDDGVTHDVGIVYAKQPFIACFCSNNVDVPRFERLMQKMTWEMAYEQ